MIGIIYNEFLDNETYVRELIASDGILSSKCDTASITGAVSVYGELEILDEQVPYEDVCLNCKLDDCDDASPMCCLRSEHGIRADGTQVNREKVVIPVQKSKLF